MVKSKHMSGSSLVNPGAWKSHVTEGILDECYTGATMTKVLYTWV